MCNRRIEDGETVGYINAAIDLFQEGYKRQAAWLLYRAKRDLQSYVKHSELRTGELIELSRIFDYMAALERREARKVSQSDSAKLLPAPGMNVAHVSRDTILEMD